MVGKYAQLLHQGILDPSHSMMNGGGKGGGSAPAPDYGPMAAASEKAAVLGKELGDATLAENKRQYDLNSATLKPAIESQQRLMDQSYAQGTQNYNTFKAEGRPVQQTMLYDALGLNAAEIAQYNELRKASVDSGRAAWQAQRDADLASINQALSRYESLAAAPSSTVQSGYAVDANGRLVTADAAAKRPTALSGSVWAGLANKTLGSRQAEYDRFLATDPKDGSVLMAYDGLIPTNGEGGATTLNGLFSGISSEGQKTGYYWAKPLQTGSSGANYTEQMKALADQKSALTNRAFDESSVGTDTANSYLAQASTAAKQRQMDEAAGTAISDARAGSNQQMNQLIRQGLRMGWSPAKLASMGGQAAMMGAQGQVAAANQARTQTDAKRTAKLGDVYNTYAGLGSSAPSFYSAGTQAGQAASGSQLGMSGQYMQGIGQGNGTIMQGQGMRMQGLGNILSSQTSAYNASMNQGDGGFGAIVGASGSIAAAMI